MTPDWYDDYVRDTPDCTVTTTDDGVDEVDPELLRDYLGA